MMIITKHAFHMVLYVIVEMKCLRDRSVVVTIAQEHLMFSILTHAVMICEGKIMSRQEESDALETRT